MENIIKIDDVLSFKDVISKANKIIIEPEININNGVLNIKSMTPDNISLLDIDFYINSDYKLDKKYINLNMLYNTVKNIKKTDSLYLHIEETKMYIEIISGPINKKLEILFIDNDNNLKIPELNFNEELKINYKELISIFKNYKNINPIFKREDDKLILIFDDGLKTDIINISGFNKIDTSYKCKYLLNYLKSFNYKLKNDVIIKFKDDYPIKIISNEKSFKISFLIAPRIGYE